ncbi:MAG: hypothetical protein HC915_03435 [Anaerolineae bacterium]|nr:hypothetical protein [Anaerolineae bacterium]
MRGRVILLVVLVLVVVAVVVGALLLAGGGNGDEPETTDNGTVTEPGEGETGQEGETEPVPTEVVATLPPIEVVPVVVAVQDLPRGFRLTEEFIQGPSPAVGVVFWPVESAPPDGYDNPELLSGLVVRSDIPRGRRCFRRRWWT